MKANRHFDHISSILLRIRNVAELQRKSKQIFYILLNFFRKNRAAYEIL
jgi:hypothetical protein